MSSEPNKTHKHLARASMEIELALNSIPDSGGGRDLRALVLRAMYATEAAETAADFEVDK